MILDAYRSVSGGILWTIYSTPIFSIARLMGNMDYTFTPRNMTLHCLSDEMLALQRAEACKILDVLDYGMMRRQDFLL